MAVDEGEVVGFLTLERHDPAAPRSRGWPYAPTAAATASAAGSSSERSTTSRATESSSSVLTLAESEPEEGRPTTTPTRGRSTALGFVPLRELALEEWTGRDPRQTCA